MDAFLTAIAPHLLELIAAVATLIIGWLAAEARARWGIEIEARHREALHSALMTGVRHAISRGLQEREDVSQAAVAYVQTSVPDAVRALKPGPQQLADMAEAKLEGWRGTPAGVPSRASAFIKRNIACWSERRRLCQANRSSECRARPAR